MAVSADLFTPDPPFAHRSTKAPQPLSETFTERQFHAGDELTVEGQGGVGFFVIESGTAQVFVDGELRRTIGPGDYFGEIALIDGGMRTATITAETDGTAYGLTSWQFRPLLEQNAHTP